LRVTFRAGALGIVLAASGAQAYTDPADPNLGVPRWTSKIRVEKWFLQGKPRFKALLTWECDDRSVSSYTVVRRASSGKETTLMTVRPRLIDRDLEQGQRYIYTIFGERVSTEQLIHSRSNPSKEQAVLVEESLRKPLELAGPVVPVNPVMPERSGEMAPPRPELFGGAFDKFVIVESAEEPSKLEQEDWLLGGGEVETAVGGKSLPLLPLESSFEVFAGDGIARVFLAQKFRLPAEVPPGGGLTTANYYRFPLAHTAAATDFIVVAGGRRTRGMICRHDEADKVFAQLTQEGRQAVLVKQAPGSYLRQALPDLIPGEEFEFRLAYFERLERYDGLWNISLPMIWGPRYTSVSQYSDSRPGRRSGRDISVSVHIDAPLLGAPIVSDTQDIEVDRSADGAMVRLRKTETIPNKDFKLRFSTRR